MGSGEDEDRSDTLRALLEFARGQRKDGRDAPAQRLRLMPGGLGGSRTVVVELVETTASGEEQRLAVRSGDGEVGLVLVREGEWIFSHGDLRIEAADRRRGGAFADVLARWLGRPLAPGTADDAPVPVLGSYAKLGERRDADGVDWDLYKLFLPGGDSSAELFMRTARAARKVAFAEKASMYREPLLRSVESALGHRRPLAQRKRVERGGQVGITVPPDWLVHDDGGHHRVTDARDDAALEFSFMQLPPLAPGAPDLRARLHHALGPSGHADSLLAEGGADRGDLVTAWLEYAFDSDDTERGARRPARGRWLLASDDRVQGFFTYYYWVDDASWAVPEWERIMDTIELGGTPVLIPDMVGSRS
jgi:hypothetical protein